VWLPDTAFHLTVDPLAIRTTFGDHDVPTPRTTLVVRASTPRASKADAVTKSVTATNTMWVRVRSADISPP
jgi:predicted 2-oxoglutarate/Fe(II)-dependent dioxygenase YbiX